MNDLASKITIWPLPRDLLMAGSRMYLEMLVSRAAASLGNIHPQVATVEPSIEKFRGVLTPGSAGVLKREFSSHGQLVFSCHSPQVFPKLERQLARDLEVYESAAEVFPRPVWFVQPYIPTVAYLGEIRVFVVNGVLFRSVITTPKPGERGELDIQEPTLLTPLSKIRSVVRFSGLVPMLIQTSLTREQVATKKLTWLASSSLSPHQEDSDRSFSSFVLNMLYRLVRAEELVTQRKSCMRIFVRMDVSVVERHGRFQYYVNELTRSHQTGLFLHWDTAGKMDLCIQDLSKVLHLIAYERTLANKSS